MNNFGNQPNFLRSQREPEASPLLVVCLRNPHRLQHEVCYMTIQIGDTGTLIYRYNSVTLVAAVGVIPATPEPPTHPTAVPPSKLNN
jgi:hypothetical protein